MTKSEVDVAVVGGGPTGLTLAGELALFGLKVVLFDRRSTRVGQARALSMHPRTIEVFGLRGLAARFISRGTTVPTGHYAALDARLDFSVLDTGFPFSLLIPQTDTEALLEERATELGVDIRRGHDVETVEQDGRRVLVAGTNAAGAFELAAGYVVGADGARSKVRAQAGIGFVGCETDRTFYFCDVKVAHGPPGSRFQVETGAGIAEGFLLRDGRYRIVFCDAARFGVPLSEPVTLAEVQDGARRMMGPEVVLSDPSWMSRFGNESKLAAQYRRDRVFLAGDAAHIHLPAGGQGMNTGIQDAMNLGWKLASVVAGRAPAGLLDSYERERRPVGQQLIDNTLAQAQLIGMSSPGERALRSAVSAMLRVPLLNRQVAGMVSALDVHYPEPLFDGYDPGLPERTGRRLPDAALRLADGTETTLYALLSRGDWIDLHLAPASVPASPAPPGIDPACIRTVEAELVSGTSSLHGPAAMLVRPDGHVAFARAA